MTHHHPSSQRSETSTTLNTRQASRSLASQLRKLANDIDGDPAPILNPCTPLTRAEFARVFAIVPGDCTLDRSSVSGYMPIVTMRDLKSP